MKIIDLNKTEQKNFEAIKAELESAFSGKRLAALVYLASEIEVIRRHTTSPAIRKECAALLGVAAAVRTADRVAV
jgi:hypothetical protein